MRMSGGESFQSGSRIREYEILDLVGRGGMGAVYRARHVYLNKIRAIKVIHSTLAPDREFTERFIREARILSELNHPNLVRLYEFGTLESGTFFMVLEFVQGESLLQRIQRQGRLSLEDSIHIIREAAQGLESAHQLGIVHRDISPDNLLLVRNETGAEITKVIDFGIAKTLMETRQFTATSMFIGKPEYCSPEQTGLIAEGETIDHRSDIYSLAITFYHMLSGKLPFYSPTPQGYFLKHATEPPRSILEHFAPGEVPAELDSFFARALAKNRNERIGSMGEFSEELSRIEAAAAEAQKAYSRQYPEETFQSFFQRGKNAFDQLEWHDAVRWWTRALEVQESDTVRQWISAAQERLRTEMEVRTQISHDLEECEQLLLQTNRQGAGAALQRAQQRMTPDFRVSDFETRIQTLRQKLAHPPAAPAPPRASKSKAVYWIGCLLAAGGMVAIIFILLLLSAGHRKEEARRQLVIREAHELIEQGHLKEAQQRIVELPVGDPAFGEITYLINTRRQQKIQALLQEGDAALTRGDAAAAGAKLDEILALGDDGFQQQVAQLKQRIDQAATSGGNDYNKIAEATRTPLMRALVNNDVFGARQLIEQGADIHAADGNGLTVLMYAIWKSPAVVDDLLRRGAEVNIRDNRGVYPLHVAADVGNVDIITQLIRAGADINAQNGLGATPLIITAMQGHISASRILINAGADLTIQTPNGFDALRTAETYNRYEIAEMIRQAQQSRYSVPAAKN